MPSDSSTWGGSRFSETSTGLRLQDRHQVANSHEIVEFFGFLRRQFALLILRRQLAHPSLVIRRKLQLQNMTRQCGGQWLSLIGPDTRKDCGFTCLGTRNDGCGRHARISESLEPWPSSLWDVIATNLHRSLGGPQRPGRPSDWLKGPRKDKTRATWESVRRASAGSPRRRGASHVRTVRP